MILTISIRYLSYLIVHLLVLKNILLNSIAGIDQG